MASVAAMVCKWKGGRRREGGESLVNKRRSAHGFGGGGRQHMLLQWNRQRRRYNIVKGGINIFRILHYIRNGSKGLCLFAIMKTVGGVGSF